MKMTISVGRCLKRKTMLVWVKEYIKKILKLAKVFATCNSYILLSKKTPKYKYWVLKALCLETQMVCSGWLKNDSLCLCLLPSSKCCVASRCNGLGLDIQRPDQEDRLQPWEQQCIVLWCESCPGTATLKEFLDQELSEHEDDEKSNDCQSSNNTKRLWLMLLMI